MRMGLFIVLAVVPLGKTAFADVRPEVRVEEDVYDVVSPDNGSGPLWSYGCTVIARSGEDVVISQMKTGIDVPRLCNTRWRLLRREGGAWKCFAEAEGYRQREPCPLCILPGGRLYLNVNDSTQPSGTMYGATDPHLLLFRLGAAPGPGERISPQWRGDYSFSDHSYRGYAADPEREQLLVFNINNKTGVQYWGLLTADGKTLSGGEVAFPIRSCYPQVALKRGAGYILAVGDIVEPVEEWRKYKFEQTQREWDYVFRILYFAWTAAAAQAGFSKPLEIANVDATAGYIGNQDLWVAPNGDAYIVYTQLEVQSALLRDKFFPGKSVLPSFRLAVVRNGELSDRQVLIEESEERQVGCARFHETPSGEVYAVLYVAGTEPGNKLMRIYPTVETRDLISIPLRQPFTSFCLAGERAGNRPSNTIDFVGHRGSGDKISYGQVVLTDVTNP
jgi:hypothetical protein